MAKVRLCDRCGERIDKRYFLKIKPVRYRLYVETEKYNWYEGIYKESNNYDLCLGCHKKLVDFLLNKETESCQDTQ